MQKKPGRLFLLLFTLTAIAGFSPKYPQPEYTTAGKPAIILKTKQLPNAELERRQPTTAITFLATEKKTSSLFEHNASLLYHTVNIISRISAAPEGDLLVKDYLFCIYPTHNFW